MSQQFIYRVYIKIIIIPNYVYNYITLLLQMYSNVIFQGYFTLPGLLLLYIIRFDFRLLIISINIYFITIYYRYNYLCRISIYLQYHEDDNNKGRRNEKKCRSITHDQIDINVHINVNLCVFIYDVI